MSTAPVVVTERGRNCNYCGETLIITVLEFYADPHPTPVDVREGFEDCPSGCTGAIDPRNPDAPALPPGQSSASLPGIDSRP